VLFDSFKWAGIANESCNYICNYKYLLYGATINELVDIAANYTGVLISP